MSYDLAVWEGKRPRTDKAAAAEYQALYATYVGGPRRVAPRPAIKRYVKALLAKWPDLDEDDDSPWSDAPLIDNARGPIVYFAMAYSRAAEASAFAAKLAKQHGLVCFDPQTSKRR